MRNFLFSEEEEAIKDRFESWELIELLQVPIEQVLEAALDNDWINEENLKDVLDVLGLKK